MNTHLSSGWHHIAASYENNTGTNWDYMYLYLDGSRVASFAGSFYYNPGLLPNNNNYNLGRFFGATWNYFTDKIDEVRISDIARYGDPYTVPSSNFVSDGNTRALWHFDEVSGSTSFADATGNGNTLTGQNGASSLPVELISFTAEVTINQVTLNWLTAIEVNNYGFEIERKLSTDWQKMGFVQGHGNSSSPKQYSFIDDKPYGGSKFQYRLKQIDNDGHFEYSDIVEVYLIPIEFALYQNYPNPFNPSTKIKYQLPKECKVHLKIYDLIRRRGSGIIK